MYDEIIVVGSGGHAKVVIEILRECGQQVAYCISNGKDKKKCLGVPVLVGDVWLTSLRAQGYHRAFVAIGSNRIRLQIANDIRALNYEVVNAISPKALISPSARFGVGVAVMAGAIVNAEAEISDFSIVNTGASVDHDCRIGQGAHIAPQCALAGMVTIDEGAFMGIASCAIPEVRIGKWSTIGAGAVVTKDIPDGVVAVGVPARQVRSI